MNPRELVDVLGTMREKLGYVTPWFDYPSSRRLALGKERSGERDWFPVSPALYEAVKELGTKLADCSTALSKLRAACEDHGIKGKR